MGSLLLVLGFSKARDYWGAPPHLRQKNMQHARSLAIVCRGFAGDNGGVFPEALEELCPSYLEESELQRLGFHAPGRRLPEQWIYLCPEDGGKNPMPMIVAPQRIGRYLIVGYSDGSVLLTKSEVRRTNGGRVR